MKVGDLVSNLYGKPGRVLGTVVRVDPEFRAEDCYVVWHTADHAGEWHNMHEGWWSIKCLKLVSKNESR